MKLAGKVVAVACVALMAGFCVAGCSSGGSKSSSAAGGTNSSSAPEPLQIVDSGYYLTDEGYLHYGVGIENPNSNYQADFPMITVTGKDANGTILFNDEQTMGVIYPNETQWVGTQAGDSGVIPATVEFSVSVRDNNWKKNNEEYTPFYTISNANVVKGDFSTKVTGQITTDREATKYDKSVNQAWITVILKNAAGEIVGGYNGFADVGAVGETRPFEVNLYKVPEYASFEVYAIPWM